MQTYALGGVNNRGLDAQGETGQEGPGGLGSDRGRAPLEQQTLHTGEARPFQLALDLVQLLPTLRSFWLNVAQYLEQKHWSRNCITLNIHRT